MFADLPDDADVFVADLSDVLIADVC